MLGRATKKKAKPSAGKVIFPAAFNTLPRVGWREWVMLKGNDLQPIKVKVDTGARTSALHAENISFVRRGKKRMVEFDVFPLQRSRVGHKRIRLELIDQRYVKSSTGHQTLRPVVKTLIELGEYLFEIELTLVNRDIMGFRMLLGRQALRHRFLVDPGHSYLLTTQKGKKR